MTVDASALGGGGSQRMYDDGTHGDAAAGDGVYTVELVAAFSSGGEARVEVTVEDSGGATARANATVVLLAGAESVERDGSEGSGPGPGLLAVVLVVLVAGVAVGVWWKVRR